LGIPARIFTEIAVAITGRNPLAIKLRQKTNTRSSIFMDVKKDYRLFMAFRRDVSGARQGTLEMFEVFEEPFICPSCFFAQVFRENNPVVEIRYFEEVVFTRLTLEIVKFT
jgi:hypothetical protein